MKIDMHTNISKDFLNVEIQINAPKRTDEIRLIEREIIGYTRRIRKIVGKQNNNFFIISIADVIKFYSNEKSNYCKTINGEFTIKEKLYYLEDVLPKESFLRISNSTIINTEFVKCFNTDTIGKIIIEMNDGTKEEGSKRRNADIFQFLKNIK